MTVYGRILLAGLGSALMLAGAFGFQILAGLEPCEMCIWQRWPHAAAVVVAILAVTLLWRQRRWLAALGAVIMAGSAGLGLFHAGIEQGWWEGFTACSTTLDPTTMTTEELMNRLQPTPFGSDEAAPALVRCDDIVWDLFGITMAGWNALISLGLASLWGASVRWSRMPDVNDA